MNKQYEEAELWRIADFHTRTLSNCPIHLFGMRKDSKGNYTYTYSAGSMFDKLGISMPLPGGKLHQLYSEEWMSQWTPQIEKSFVGKVEIVDTDLPNQMIKTVLYPVKDKNKIVAEVVGTSYILPKQEMQKDEEIQSLQRFKQLFNHVMDAIILCHHDFRIAELNAKACELLRMERHDLINKNAADFFMKNGKIRAKKRDHLMNGQKVSGEFRFKTANGFFKEIEYTCEKEIVEDFYVIILKDITERKITEQKLLKAETLNVVGELAAGVAHEIRNPLTSLKGFVQLIQNQTGDYDQYLSIILSEVDRIEHIIKEFLVLSKSNSQNFELANVGEIIQDTVQLLNTQAIMRNIEILTEYEGDLPPIYCDPMQLKQVFINFVKNGIEASGVGGCVKVVMKKINKEAIQIQIRDNGCGMDEEVFRNIGKPFYTTKEDGTGLGLMVSSNIIKHHNGRLDVQSEKGKGTNFIITLPIQTESRTV
jgi:PAS domain S-box-containing protein